MLKPPESYDLGGFKVSKNALNLMLIDLRHNVLVVKMFSSLYIFISKQ